ncbi:MAG: HAD-IA family hydrolase [Candidatus Andersenbacteria bacterium]
MIAAVLFDVDGTLLDAREFIFQAFEHVFTMHHLPAVARQQLALISGKPLEECYRLLAPQLDTALLCQEHRMFQEQHFNLLQPFPHTVVTLQQLQARGIATAAITNRRQSGVQSLAHTGVLDYLTVVITGDDVTKLKPDPEGLFKALEVLQVAPTAAAMVGDTDADILAGKRAGIKTIGVTYGFFAAADLQAAAPDVVVDDIADIIAVVTKHLT